MLAKVDCIINVCGKPLQTELALRSLLRHSGHHINRIFIINERKELGEHTDIRDCLPNTEYYETKYSLWINPVDTHRLTDDEYRLSVRYQYGWERSDREFVFITHNDCVYHNDIVGLLLENIGDSIASGSIGQCWNCPANWAMKCNPERYWDYRPSFEELVSLYHNVVPPARHVKRPYHLPAFHNTFELTPWPLPECRVNEWCALIRLSIARDITIPAGPALPFGAYLTGGAPILDIGVGWFRDISNMGYRCSNFPMHNHIEHSAGHPAMLDRNLYAMNELKALERLRRDYGKEYDLCRG